MSQTGADRSALPIFWPVLLGNSRILFLFVFKKEGKRMCKTVLSLPDSALGDIFFAGVS